MQFLELKEIIWPILNYSNFSDTVHLGTAPWKRSHYLQSNLNSSNTDGLFELSFESLRNSSNRSKKQIFKEAFLFHYEIVCCVYSLELPLRGNSNEYTQHTVIV